MKRNLLILIISVVFVSLCYSQDYIWANYIQTTGATSFERAYFDKDGNVYATMTLRRDGFVTNIPHENVEISNRHIGGGTQDVGLVKYSPTGEILWLRSFGSVIGDFFKGFIVDDFGNSYIIAQYRSEVFVDIDGGVDSSLATPVGNSFDMMMIKYDSNGNIIFYKNIISGPGTEVADAMVFNDDSTKIIISGTYTDNAVFNNNIGTPFENPSAKAAFVAFYDLNGNCESAKVYVDNPDLVLGAISSYGSLGTLLSFTYKSSVTLFDENNTYNFVNDGNSDIVTTLIDNNGSILWSIDIKTSGSDNINGCYIDNENNFYLAGKIEGSSCVFNSTDGQAIERVISSAEAFIVKYNTLGKVLWVNLYGSNLADHMNRLDVLNDKIFFSGTFYSNSLSIGRDFVSNLGGSADIFYGMTDIDGKNYGAKSIGGASADWGYHISVDEITNEIVLAGITYSPQIIFDDFTIFNPNSPTAYSGYIAKVCPLIRFIGLEEFYCSDGIGGELKGHPVGGVFSGSGVSGNIFDPTSLSAGSYEITYTYTDVPEGCATTYTLTANIGSVPTIDNVNAEYCLNATSVALEGTPAGGEFKINGNVVTELVPSSLGIGTHTVSYTYTYPSSGCEETVSQNVTINPLPNVSLSSFAAVCEGGALVDLSEKGSPVGGTYSGTNVSGTNFNPSSSGIFEITYTYTGANSCTNSASRNITVNSLPGISFSALSDLCDNVASVSLIGKASPTGGFYTGTGVTSNNFNPSVGEGVYSITYTYTDENNCTNTASQSQTVLVSPSATFGATGEVCHNNGLFDLSSFVNPIGGVFVGSGISGNSINPDIAGLGTKSYSYIYTAANSCKDTAIQSITISEPSLPEATNKSGLEGGVIPDLTAVGTDIKWYSDINLTNLVHSGSPFTTPHSTVGVYTYYVTQTVDGCESDAKTVILTITDCTVNEPIASNENVCYGETVPLLSAVAVGSGSLRWYSDPNLYYLVGTGNTYSTGKINPGIYTYYVAEYDGCQGPAKEVILTINSLPTVNVSASKNTICPGESVTLSSSSATSNVWSNAGETTQSIIVSPLSSSTYSVSVTDANGCVSSAPSSISVLSNPIVSLSASKSTICNGESTLLFVSGASSYVWDNGLPATSNNTVSPITTTTYSVTGTDANGCSASASRIIDVNPLPTITATSNLAEICKNSTAIISATGGSTYEWNNSVGLGSTHTVYPISTTTYTVTGTDNNGCSNTSQVPVNVNNLPSLVLNSSTTSVCLGSSAVLTVSGASTYSWSNSLGSGNTKTVSPTSSTSYSVTGTDVNGCVNSASISLSVKPLPVLLVSDDMGMCSGGSATISASGNSTLYTWSHGLGTGAIKTVSPSSTTTYTVTGTLDGCSTSAQTMVFINYLPTVSFNPTTDLCIGSSKTLSVTGNATSYLWSDDLGFGTSKTVSPTIPTIYSVTATSAQGCTNNASYTLGVNNLPEVTLLASSNTICAGQSVTLTAGGGDTYSWSEGPDTGNEIIVSPLATTIYSVTATDANGCQESSSITITVNPLPSVIAMSSNNDICIGETITINAAGALNYVWDNSLGNGASHSVTPLTSTLFSVTGTDINNCSSTAIIDVNVRPVPIPTVSVNPESATICIGDTAILTASGASIYMWNSGQNTGSIHVNPTVSATYTVVGTDDNGCSGTASAEVTVLSLPNISITETETTICENESVTLSAFGGNTYIWNTGDATNVITKSPSNNYTYYVTGTDANNCSNVASSTIIVMQAPSVVAWSNNNEICEGEFTNINVTGAVSYEWSNSLADESSHTVSPANNITYFVTGTDVNNCVGVSSVSIIVNPNPSVSLLASNSTICSLDEVTFTASGADSYSWDNNLGTGAIKNINPTQTTTYTVTGANSFNCTNTASVEIVVNPLPTVIASSDISICDGSTGNISVTGNASTYTWSESLGTGTNKTVSPIVETTYTVTGESLAGCFNTDNVTVSINNLPIVTFNSLVNNPICENSEINERIDGLVNPFGGIFNGNGVVASGSEVYFYPELATASTSPHTITYSYTDANGCTNSASQIVTVNEVPSINFDVVAPICIDNSPITLSATPIGGIFSGVGVDGNTFDPSVSGSGSINVNYSYTDLNGCSNIKEQNITVNPLPSVVFGTINDLCLSNPPIDLTGHALPLGGTYSGPGVNSTTSIFDPEVAGVNYTPGHIINYSYTDANGCTSDSDQYLLVKDDPNIVWDDIPTAVCLNDNVVTLSATPIGGVFSGNGVVGNQFYPSLAGAGTNNLITYTYYDFPGTGCSAVSTYYIRVNDVPLVATSDDITICEGLSADISVTGNALTYNWSNGLGNGTTKTVTPSTSTTYTVTAVSSEGCEISDIVTVNVVSKPNVYASSDVEICNGNSTQLSVLGNAASYTWSTSEQTSSITVSPTTTTTYTVVGTTLEGCENSDNVIVTVNPIPYILASTTNPEFCIGNSTLLNASGASTYVWDNNLGEGANKTVSPTVATTYNVLGTDLKGCVGQGSVTINVNPRPTVNAGDDIILCKTDTALVTATSNTIDLIWNNGLGSGASHNVSPTTTTVYTVTATDENGCTSTDNIEVTVYNKPSISITPSSSNVCEGSSVSLSVSGALNYVWSNNLGTSNTINVTPSAETTYSVTGTDSRGCSNIASSTIGIKPVPSVSISAIDTTVCKGVSTYVKAHGANSYVWNNNLSSIEENLITPIVSTTYSVTGTNSYGCSSTGQLAINVKELPTALASAERTRINYGAQANLLGFVSGGTGTEYEYLWTPSNLIENSDTIQNPTSISMSESNIFTLVATDEFGCESNQSSIIINVEGGAMSIIPLGDEICAGNKADLTVLTSGGSGEFEYSWEPSELLEDANVFNPKSFELLETTEFTVLVKDTQTNDTRTSTVLVLVNQLPIVDASGDVAVCSGAELQMSVAGNANSYLWSNGLGYGETKTIVATNSIAYIVTGVDSNACVNTDTVFINTYQSPTKPEIIVDGDIPFCLGDSVKLKVETIEGLTYNWSNNVEADSIYISESGQYSVMAFDENGCESQNSETIFAYNITPPQQPTISVVGATTICYGDTVELSSSSGVNYLWSNGSEQQTIFVINGGEYSVRISDNNGCVSEYSEIVEVSTMFAPEKPLLSVSGNIDLCFGAEQKISAPEGYSYLWSNGETGSSIAVTESGEYFVQISDNGSCLSVESDTAIVNFEMITTSVAASETEVCFGTEVQLSATGGTEYLWSDGNHGDTIYYDAQLSGYVYVTVTDGECVGIDSVYISVIPGVYVNLGNNINVCEGNRVTLGSVEGDEILWSTGETSETISFIPTQTDVYKVTVSSGICSASDSVIVNLIPNPIIDLGEDVSICEGQSIELQIEDGYEYSWSTGDTTTSITVSQSGNYVVTATNNGCEVYDNILVTVIQNPIIDMIAENPDCGEANGSVTLDITTQGSDLTYLWNSFPQDLLDNVNTTGDKLENIASGLYSVVVTDGECSSFAEMILNDEVINTPITGVYSNKETVCRGEEVELTVEGDAWTLMWYPREAVTPNSGNRVTARPTQTTTYHVFATVGGCTVSESITINVDQPPVFDLQSNVSFCDGESIIVDAGQFDSYLWSNGSNSRQISISQEGLYSVTVTDGVCSVFDTLMAIKLPKPLVSIETVNANCGSSNGSIEIEALDENDEYFYLWENGLTSNSLFDIASGTYNVEINNSDCSINHEVLISDSDGPNVNIVASKQEILLGESVILEVTGADTYNWNLTSDMNLISYDEAVVSPSQTTTYSVEGVFNGCKSLASITIDVITNLDVNIGEDITVCEGEVVTLSSNIEGNYIWSNGSTSPSINVTQSGIYSLTVTQNQAIGYDYVRVSVLPIPKVELSVFDASCGETDGMIVASTYDLVDYMWSNNTINDTLQNVEAGIYTLTVSNTACSSEYEILIKNADVEPISLIANKTQVCLGEELAITTNENISINWSNSENDISITSDTLVVAPLQTTMYYGSIENSNGCERFGSIEIEVVNYPQSELPVSSTICLGGEVTLNAGPYAQSYMWSDGNTNQTINVSSPGTYSVTLSNGACSIISSTTISEIQGPELVASFVNPSCGMSNGQISLNVNGGQEPYTYSWNTTPTQSGSVVSNIPAGIYTVRVSDASCTIRKDIQLANVGAPVLSLSSNSQTICHGNSANVTVSGANEYIWRIKSGDFITSTRTLEVSPTQTTSYIVEGQVDGCKSYAEFKVNVNSLPQLSFVGLPTSICEGSNPISLNALPTGGIFKVGSTQTLVLDPSIIPNTVNVTYDYTNPITGCRNYIASAVTKLSAPEVEITNSSTNICNFADLRLYASPTGGSFYINGTPQSSFDVSTISTHGQTFDVEYRYTNPNNGCVGIANKEFTKFSTPTANFTYYAENGKVGFVNQSLNANTYLWNFGGGVTSRLEDPEHTFAQSGNQAVSLVAYNPGCQSTLLSRNILITTDISENKVENSFVLTPNPTKGLFELQYVSSYNGLVNIEITSISGAEIEKTSIFKSKDLLSIYFDLSNITKGIYNVKIIAGEYIETKQIIVY